MRRVMLVDDDPGFVETFGALLRFEGYAVIAESTYNSAREYLSTHSPPDVLITDITIGSSNGWELVRYANQYQPGLPVVVITGLADLHIAKWEYFHTPVFLKPFDPDELFDYLRRHLNG
jgi:two-component system C4-dicarboxylate transport response regulator DctD